jgi:hypothetical protein
MIEDEGKFKAFLHEIKQKMDSIVSAGHVGFEVVDLIKDFKVVINAFEASLSDKNNQGYSMKVMKKRTDQLILEKKEVEKIVDNLKKIVIPTIISELKSISLECNSITSREANTESPQSKSADSIRKSIQKIVETFANNK